MKINDEKSNKSKKILLIIISILVLILAVLITLFVMYDKEKKNYINENVINKSILELIYKVEGKKGLESYAEEFKKKGLYENYEVIYNFLVDKKILEIKDEMELFVFGGELRKKQLYYIADRCYKEAMNRLYEKIQKANNFSQKIEMEKVLIKGINDFVFEYAKPLEIIGKLSDNASDKVEINLLEECRVRMLIKLEKTTEEIVAIMNNKLNLEEKEAIYTNVFVGKK